MQLQHAPSPLRDLQEAEKMLMGFESAGAIRFDLTLTTLQGHKARFQRGVSLGELTLQLPALLQEAKRQEHNVIVRPHPAPPVFLLQLDDLNEQGIQQIQWQAFLCLQTSHASFQAWLALQQADHDLAKRLRRGLNADPHASGAARLAGSLNFKAKYAPHFPCVEIVHLSAGRIADGGALSAFCAEPPGNRTPLLPLPVHSARRARRFPDYERCLDRVPLNHSGSGPDRSLADFTFCLLSIDWGWSVAETAARLLEVSAKAKENGARYARRTAQRAQEALLKRERRG